MTDPATPESLIDEATLPRAQIDADYTARLTCPDEDFRRIIGDYARLSQAAYALPGVQRDLIHDAISGQRLDLFGTAPGESRPCLVFIHGGYWRALSKEHSAFMAPMLAGRGIATAAVDYALAPEASLTEITRQCRAALAFLWHNASRLGIDAGRIVVAGSSAGGHLAAAVAGSGWQAGMGLPQQPLKGVLPISGLFELAPLAASHVNDWMRFTPAEIADLSPIRHLPAGNPTLAVALAEQETPGFHRQSAAYGRATGAPVLTIDGRNHFDVILDLTNPDSQLSRALLDLF